MKTILLPPHNSIKFAIFGKIHYLDYFLKRIRAEGFPVPVVFVSPEQQYVRDRRLLARYGLYSDLESLEREGYALTREFEDVNDPECLKEIAVHGCNVGFSINCRNIIKRALINLFEGRLFNIHASYLSNERGGALNTWRILNNIRFVGNTIHQIDEGIDTGDIAFQEQMELKEEFPLPIDYDRAQILCCRRIFDQFIAACTKREAIRLRPQDNQASVYFPRLYTEVNGAIDWNWEASNVEKFIRAFSDPYPGAYTFVKGKKLHILRATIEARELRFHSFCNGKVIAVNEDRSVGVIAGGRVLRINRVSLADGTVIDAGAILRAGQTLVTPPSILAKARRYVPRVQEMK